MNDYSADSPRVDLSLKLSNREGRENWSELLAMARGRAQTADALGYHGVWLGEHHFERDGSDVVPNPVMLGADLAARTERMRICMGAVTATVWHPLRLAEDLAMLDHFSRGRLEVAFSRGIAASEIVNLNPEADRRGSQETSKAIWHENLEIVRRAWSEDKFNWQGERHTFPQPGIQYKSAPGAPKREGYTDENGEMVKMSLAPRPLQSPTPPMWSVTETEGGFTEAAEAGLGAITWYPTGKRLRGLLELHRDTVARKTGRKLQLGENCALSRLTLVAKTDAEARERFEPALNDHYEFIYNARKENVWLDEGEDPNDPSLEGVKPFELLMERNHLLVGSPETVVERIKGFGKSHGIRHWLISTTMPGVDPAAADESIELFGQEVLPALTG